MGKKNFLIYLFVFFILNISSFALFGGGGKNPMSEILEIVKRMETNQITMKLEDIEQTLKQAQMIENQLKNMMNLDAALTTGQLAELQKNFGTLMNIQNSVKSKINDYSNFQNQFKSVFTDFTDFKNLTPDEYISHANKLLNHSRNAMEDGLRLATGMKDTSKLSSDAMRVQAIMNATNSAVGQQQVMQAGVQMASMQVEVLTDMRTLFAESLNAQSQYTMKQIQDEKLSYEHTESLKKTIDVSEKKTDIIKILKGK